MTRYDTGTHTTEGTYSSLSYQYVDDVEAEPIKARIQYDGESTNTETRIRRIEQGTYEIRQDVDEILQVLRNQEKENKKPIRMSWFTSQRSQALQEKASSKKTRQKDGEKDEFEVKYENEASFKKPKDGLEVKPKRMWCC